LEIHFLASAPFALVNNNSTCPDRRCGSTRTNKKLCTTAW
jgi:hypothetical protein